MVDKIPSRDELYKEVLKAIEEIEQKGFGEVKVFIQNKSIYRIRKTEDTLTKK